ncbi:prolyl endopeptidase-like [Aplochiton taeniatus]
MKVQGLNHVYYVEGDRIYRMDTRHTDPEPEQVLCLDQGSVAELGDEEWSLQRVRLSPRERVLAASLKTPHREEPRCVLVRLGGDSGAVDPPQTILTLDKVFSFEWATDELLFYTSQEGLKCNRVFRLDLNSNRALSTLVYEDTQPDVFVELSLSRDRKLITINCSSKTSSEVWLVDKATPLSEPTLVQPRLSELLYHVEHWRGQLIILANTGPGREYQVVRAPLSSPSMEQWVPVCTPSPGATVRDMEVVGDRCVLLTRDTMGLLALLVVPLAHPEDQHTVQLPAWACAVETIRADLEDHRGALEFLLSSPIHPPVPYRYCPMDGLLLLGTEKDRTPLMDQDQGYHTTRLEAPSQDGSQVPVTLLHAAPLKTLRQAPLLVHVYGAYGKDLNMEFSPERRLLVEHGWALAYCHVRGGGERGLSWHRQGRVEGKLRGLEDLAACLQLLFSLEVSSPSLAGLSACSAGAVLAGALCNTHPHLLRAVTLQAPFVDVLGSMSDPSLPLTLEEREEWGDPLAEPRHQHTVASYCPCHNVTPQSYPSVLLTAYTDDARVPVAGVKKYVERLRAAMHTHFITHPAAETGTSLVLNLQPGADHFGPQNFELALKESSLQLAFLYAELGLELPKPLRRRR